MKKLAVGIDLGATNIKGALVNEDGEFLAQDIRSTPSTEGRQAVIDRICSVIDTLISTETNVAGIGIGTPGIVAPESGTIIGASPNIADWVGTPLRSILSARYNLPAAVDNDVNAVTMGEYCFGKAGFSDNLACIAIGTGIGIGIVLDNKLFRKAHEMGHMVVKYDGLACGCGRLGCAEAFISARGLINNYRTVTGKSSQGTVINPETIFGLYTMGDKNAQSVIGDFISALSSVIVNLVLSYSITNFIIGGGISHSFPLFSDSLRDEVYKRSISHLNNKITLKEASLSDRAGILGAASLILK